MIGGRNPTKIVLIVTSQYPRAEITARALRAGAETSRRHERLLEPVAALPRSWAAAASAARIQKRGMPQSSGNRGARFLTCAKLVSTRSVCGPIAFARLFAQRSDRSRTRVEYDAAMNSSIRAAVGIDPPYMLAVVSQHSLGPRHSIRIVKRSRE